MKGATELFKAACAMLSVLRTQGVDDEDYERAVEDLDSACYFYDNADVEPTDD